MTYNDAVHYLMHEVSIFDTEDKALYFLDVAGEPKVYHGIQIFHIKADKNVVVKALKEGYSLTDFCLERIPAPGTCCGNENGYSEFFAFDEPENIEDYYEDAKYSVMGFVNRLEKEGILERCVVDEAILP